MKDQNERTIKSLKIGDTKWKITARVIFKSLIINKDSSQKFYAHLMDRTGEISISFYATSDEPSKFNELESEIQINNIYTITNGNISLFFF